MPRCNPRHLLITISLLTTETRNCYLSGRMVTSPQPLQIQIWPIDRLVFYARNPRKNDAAVDRMCSDSTGKLARGVLSRARLQAALLVV